MWWNRGSPIHTATLESIPSTHQVLLGCDRDEMPHHSGRGSSPEVVEYNSGHHLKVRLNSSPSIPACLRMPFRVPLFNSRCRGTEKTRLPLLHDNMGRGLPLRNETMPGKLLHHLFPRDNRQLMRHQLRQPSISHDGRLMPADAPLSTAPQEQVLSLL